MAAPDSILIADGSFMQRRHRRNWDIAIFTNTSFEEAVRRGIGCDAEQFGGNAAAERRYAHRYHAAARPYVYEIEPAQSADFIVDNDDPINPRLHGSPRETVFDRPR
ncbi:MAG TPA: hypothetical protein VGO30_12655 [Mycobacterium sp.]|nr:hypothetical protein [Mycobacterium sp.]